MFEIEPPPPYSPPTTALYAEVAYTPWALEHTYPPRRPPGSSSSWSTSTSTPSSPTPTPTHTPTTHSPSNAVTATRARTQHECWHAQTSSHQRRRLSLPRRGPLALLNSLRRTPPSPSSFSPQRGYQPLSSHDHDHGYGYGQDHNHSDDGDGDGDGNGDGEERPRRHSYPSPEVVRAAKQAEMLGARQMSWERRWVRRTEKDYALAWAWPNTTAAREGVGDRKGKGFKEEDNVGGKGG